MKKLLSILPLALILCLVTGCQDKEAMAELEEFRAQAALEEANKALFMRAEEAWFKEDVEALIDLLWTLFGHQNLLRFLTPMVVKIYLLSSTSDYILTRIV